jgi:hypothetical protein
MLDGTRGQKICKFLRTKCWTTVRRKLSRKPGLQENLLIRVDERREDGDTTRP